MPQRTFLNSVILVAALALAAHAQPGSLDPIFGSNGVNTTFVSTTQNNLSPEQAIAIQSDGKILTMADAHLNTGNSFTNVVIRYNADGSLDSTFGSGGFLYMNWNGLNNTFGNAYSLATQVIGSDEKIIVAGSQASGGLRVDRYNSDGSVDTSFGTNGRTIITNGGYALAVAIQTDGKIVTIGDVGTMVRLNVDGSLDKAFGSGGIVQTSLKSRTLGLQSTNKIITCGGATSGRGGIYVERFNSNGTLDGSFGSSGKASVPSCNNVAIDRSDRVLAGGSVNQANSTKKVTYFDFAVTRLTAAGQVDNTFGVGGTCAVDIAGFNDTVWSVKVQASGQILLVGTANSTSTDQNTGVARLNSNGTLDTTFGQNGRVMLDLTTASEYTRAGAIQLDPACGCEKLITSGTAELSGIDYAIAARYIL